MCGYLAVSAAKVASFHGASKSVEAVWYFVLAGLRRPMYLPIMHIPC